MNTIGALLVSLVKHASSGSSAMFRVLFKLFLLTAILVGGGGYLAGWWDGRDLRQAGERAVATTGIDATRAREIGAEVKERTSDAAQSTRRAISESSLTAKIKAKMALDDRVKARGLNVDTEGSVVTVSGTVHSDAERQRALRLARETDGVTKVVDRIEVQR
jgi:osmotically-inducible protein OsmY